MPRFLWTQKQDFGATPRAGAGIAYDPVRKVWLTPSTAGPYGGDNSAASWAANLMKLAKRITSGNDASFPDVWSGVFVGGCCKSGTDEIKALCHCRSL